MIRPSPAVTAAACWLAVSATGGIPSERAPQAVLDAREVAARADAWLSAYAAAGDFSGVILIAQGDRILMERAYGKADSVRGTPNTVGTRFRVASLTKTFTAAAVELLIDRGQIGLKDPLSRYVSGIANGEAMTIEHLLLHRSGIGVLDTPDRYLECLPETELLRRLRVAKPLFLPGQGGEYSNEGYFLLALVIEKASGIPYERFLRDNIFGPLGMKDSGIACRDLPAGPNASGHVPGPKRNSVSRLPLNEAAEIGPGSAFSNARDLLAWLRAADAGEPFRLDKWSYPYGWGARDYSGRPLVEQSGIVEGFNAHIALYPAEDIYAVVLSNVQSGLFNRVPKDLEKVLFGGETTRPPVVRAVAMDDPALRDYEGEYASEAIPFRQELSAREGRLSMRWGQYPFPRALTPVAKDEFFFRYEYATVRFRRDASGRVVSMSWQWPEGEPMIFRKL